MGQDAMLFEMGDGGNLENSGLLALLQRNARKVAMWVSTYISLSSTIDFCNLPPDIDLDKVLTNTENFSIAPMVTDKFGYPYQDEACFYTHNQVFAKEEFPPLMCEMQRLKRDG